MPKGLRRFHHTGDWDFITCSCYHRQKFLDSVRRRDLFLDSWSLDDLVSEGQTRHSRHFDEFLAHWRA